MTERSISVSNDLCIHDHDLSNEGHVANCSRRIDPKFAGNHCRHHYIDLMLHSGSFMRHREDKKGLSTCSVVLVAAECLCRSDGTRQLRVTDFLPNPGNQLNSSKPVVSAGWRASFLLSGPLPSFPVCPAFLPSTLYSFLSSHPV